MSRAARWITPAALVVALSAPLVMAASPAFAQADGGQTVTINPSIGHETFEGWGTSLAWFAHIMGGAPLPIRTRLANLLFSDVPGQGLGLTVVRYNIGGGENPAYDFMQVRAQIPGYEPTPGHYNWNADKRQRWFLSAAIQRGANQIEAFSNSPPWWMTVSGSVTGAADGGTNLKTSEEGAFASYLATVVDHFSKHWGVTFRTVEPFNEPVSFWWKFGGSQEGSHIDNQMQNDIIPLLGKDLQRDGLITTVAAPDDNSIDETFTSFSSYGRLARTYVSQINTHSYNGSARGSLQSLAQHAGKDLWMSEYGDGDSTGLTMSEQILMDMKQMQPTAWVYWQAVDLASAGGWGFLTSHLNHESNYSLAFNEKYYVMGNYSEFIRPGYQFIHTGDSQTLAAYDWHDHKLVLVVTNDQLMKRSLQYSLSDFQQTGPAAQVYRTDDDGVQDNLARLAMAPIHHGQLAVTLPPFSVTTFVIPDAVYTLPNSRTVELGPVRAPGVSALGDAWSTMLPNTKSGGLLATKAGATMTLSFHGTRALLLGDLSKEGGILSVSVDGGSPVDVDEYAESAQSNVVIYASPTLSPGHHTMTVTLTGLRDAATTGDGDAVLTAETTAD